MFRYIGRRLVYMVPTLLIISIISFILIQLPPGDYLSAMQAELSETGDIVDDAVLDGFAAAATAWTSRSISNT